MRLLSVLSVVFIVSQATCFAQTFNVGDRVFVDSFNESGVVHDITSIRGAGGFAVNVKMDKTGSILMLNPNHLHASGGRAAGLNRTPPGDVHSTGNPTNVNVPGTGSAPPPRGKADEQFRRGDRVFVPSTGQYGTVLETTNISGVGGHALSVRMDKFGDITTFDPSHLKHTNLGTPNLSTTAVPRAGAGVGAGSANPAATQSRANQAPAQVPQGAGLPPSGRYKGILTIGRSLMGSLGLTISGTHYTAGSLSGTISMGAGGQISFSNGLGGLQGCTIRNAVFVPAGRLANHPTIEVFITTPGGRGSQIDYSLE